MSEQLTSQTRLALQPYIQKTPLTDKLLSRPPFRYLFDLVLELRDKTGFMRQELALDRDRDINNFNDKQAKVEWLDRVVAYAQKISGQTVKAKPGRIVAGVDVEDTNSLLRLMASIARHLSSKETSNMTGKGAVVVDLKKSSRSQKEREQSMSRPASLKPEPAKPIESTKMESTVTSEAKEIQNQKPASPFKQPAQSPAKEMTLEDLKQQLKSIDSATKPLISMLMELMHAYDAVWKECQFYEQESEKLAIKVDACKSETRRVLLPKEWRLKQLKNAVSQKEEEMTRLTDEYMSMIESNIKRP